MSSMYDSIWQSNKSEFVNKYFNVTSAAFRIIAVGFYPKNPIWLSKVNANQFE